MNGAGENITEGGAEGNQDFVSRREAFNLLAVSLLAGKLGALAKEEEIEAQVGIPNLDITPADISSSISNRLGFRPETMFDLFGNAYRLSELCGLERQATVERSIVTEKAHAHVQEITINGFTDEASEILRGKLELYADVMPVMALMMPSSLVLDTSPERAGSYTRGAISSDDITLDPVKLDQLLIHEATHAFEDLLQRAASGRRAELAFIEDYVSGAMLDEYLTTRMLSYYSLLKEFLNTKPENFERFLGPPPFFSLDSHFTTRERNRWASIGSSVEPFVDNVEGDQNENQQFTNRARALMDAYIEEMRAGKESWQPGGLSIDEKVLVSHMFSYIDHKLTGPWNISLESYQGWVSYVGEIDSESNNDMINTVPWAVTNAALRIYAMDWLSTGQVLEKLHKGDKQRAVEENEAEARYDAFISMLREGHGGPGLSAVEIKDADGNALEGQSYVIDIDGGGQLLILPDMLNLGGAAIELGRGELKDNMRWTGTTLGIGDGPALYFARTLRKAELEGKIPEEDSFIFNPPFSDEMAFGITDGRITDYSYIEQKNVPKSKRLAVSHDAIYGGKEMLVLGDERYWWDGNTLERHVWTPPELSPKRIVGHSIVESDIVEFDIETDINSSGETSTEIAKTTVRLPDGLKGFAQELLEKIFVNPDAVSTIELTHYGLVLNISMHEEFHEGSEVKFLFPWPARG